MKTNEEKALDYLQLVQLEQELKDQYDLTVKENEQRLMALGNKINGCKGNRKPVEQALLQLVTEFKPALVVQGRNGQCVLVRWPDHIEILPLIKV